MKKSISLILFVFVLISNILIINAETLHLAWVKEDGKEYWYENNVKQGVYGSKGNVFYDNTERGREIYDPLSNAWYWLDSVYDGAKAVNKEVFMPYIYSNEDTLYLGKGTRHVEGGYQTIHHDAVTEKQLIQDGHWEEKCWAAIEPAGYAPKPGVPWEQITAVNGEPPENHPEIFEVVNITVEHREKVWVDTSYYKDVVVKDAWDEQVWVDAHDEEVDLYNEEALVALANESNTYTESNITANMSEQVYNAIKNKAGKWVRYDENGKMIKGWYRVEEKDRQYYPNQVGNTYFYDYKTGLMAKGWTKIDGENYYFDEVTGVLK